MADTKEQREWKEYWLHQAVAHGQQRAQEQIDRCWTDIGHRAGEISLEFQWRRIYRIRVRHDDPTWVPTGMLSGGGWLSSVYGLNHTKRYFRMLGNRKQKWCKKSITGA